MIISHAQQLHLNSIYQVWMSILYSIVTGSIRFQRTYLFGYFINLKVSLAVCCQCSRGEGRGDAGGWQKWFLICRTGRVAKTNHSTGWGRNQVSPFHGLARIYGLINVPSGPGLFCSRAGRRGCCCSTGLQCEKHWCGARSHCQNVSMQHPAKCGCGCCCC